MITVAWVAANLALGAEYRKDRAQVSADALAAEVRAAQERIRELIAVASVDS